MDAKLVVVGGEAPASEYQLSLPTIVGRSRGADIKIGHPLVSRKHCEFFESDDGQLMIRDLGSLNGTFVGDSRISDVSALPPGATVTIGAVTFQAIYGDMNADTLADGDTSEMPDFLSAPEMSPGASATPMEPTLEMSEMEPHGTEPVQPAGNRDAGFDFNWLEDAPEEDDSPPAKASPKAAAAKEEPDFDDPPVTQAADDEFNFPEGLDAEQNGAAEEDEFASTEQQPTAGRDDDDDFGDFLANLK